MRLCTANVVCRVLAPALLLAVVALPVTAQESDPAAAERINQLYQQSRVAENVEDYNDLLSELTAIESLEISEGQTTYLTNLASWLYTERGKMYVAQGDAAYDDDELDTGDELHRQALADFDMALERNPESWKALHNRSVSRAMFGEYEDALADIDTAIKLAEAADQQQEAEYARLWFNRGEIYYDQGQDDEAIASYTRLLELTPRDGAVVVARGHAYLRVSQPRLALADFQTAIQILPNSAVARSARGETYAALGRWGEAAADLRRAIELDDQFAPSYQRAAWFMATCPQAEFRQPELAVEAAKQAIALDEYEEWRSYDALAAAQARNGDFAAAREAIATAQVLAENDGEEAALAQLAARAELYAQDEPYTLPNP